MGNGFFLIFRGTGQLTSLRLSDWIKGCLDPTQNKDNTPPCILFPNTLTQFIKSLQISGMRQTKTAVIYLIRGDGAINKSKT